MAKIIKCKTCGADIASSAKSCPGCGARNKKPFYTKIWFWILIVIIIGVAASGGDSSSTTGQNAMSTNTDSQSNDTDIQQSSSNEKTTDVKEVYLLGEVAELKEVSLQVTGIEYSQGSEYDKPKADYEFAIVNVSIKNTSESTQSYNVYNFSIQNGNGQIESQAFTTINSDSALGSGEIAPGGAVSGSIAFEVPKNDSALKLLFSDNIFSDKNIVFDLVNSLDTFDIIKGDKVTISEDLPQIGEPVDFKNMRVTVDSVDKSSGDGYNKPSSGNEYITVTITLENIDSKTQAYNPFDFKLQNSSGTIQTQTFTTINSETAMSSGELASGGKFTSTITFEAPIDDEELGLIYEPNWLIGDRTMIRLK